MNKCYKSLEEGFPGESTFLEEKRESEITASFPESRHDQIDQIRQTQMGRVT